MNPKKVLDKLEKYEEKLDIKIRVASSLAPIKDLAEDKIKTSIRSNDVLLVEEVAKAVVNSLADTKSKKVVQELEAVTKDLASEIGKLAVNEIKSFVKSIDTLGQKNYFDQKSFEKSFEETLAGITAVLQSQKEMPIKVEFEKNSKGKVVSSKEIFKNHTVKHEWSYNDKGMISEIKTTRIDNQS